MTTDETTREARRILVIDDNDAIHNDFRKTLAGRRCAVGEALQQQGRALRRRRAGGQTIIRSRNLKWNRPCRARKA